MKTTVNITELKNEMFNPIAKDKVVKDLNDRKKSIENRIKSLDDSLTSLESAKPRTKKTKKWMDMFATVKYHKSESEKDLCNINKMLTKINNGDYSELALPYIPVVNVPSVNAEDSCSACYSQEQFDQWVDEFVSMWGECDVNINTDAFWSRIIEPINKSYSDACEDYSKKKQAWCNKYGCN